MIWFFLLFVVFLLFRISVLTGSETNREYLSVEQTQIVKGIFICIVFFSHFHSYVTYTSVWDEKVQWFTGLLGQNMVAPFLFYSGYGIMLSIQRKGKPYVKSIPRKRILATLFRFDCAVLLFIALALVTGQYRITGKLFLQAMIAWESVGNSYWYIFVVLALYSVTYCAFLLCKDQRVGLLVCFLLVCAGIFAFVFWNIKDICWYDTALCYILGMTYAQYRVKFEKVFQGNRLIYSFLVTFLLALVLYMQRYEYKPLGSCIRTSLFALTVTAITMRVRISSKLLQWCGKHLFSLYILQRIPMIALQYLGLGERSIPLYFACCVVITVCMVYPFEWVTDQIWNKLDKMISPKHAAC